MHNWKRREVGWPHECTKCGAASHTHMKNGPDPTILINEYGYCSPNPEQDTSINWYVYSCEEYLLYRVLHA